VSGCAASNREFAVYRVAEPSPGSPDVAEAEIQNLPLEPTPALRVEDIVSYSRSRHFFELREGVASRFADDDGRFFVAMVGSERIFVAGYLAPWSSLAFLGTTLRVFPGTPTHLTVTTVPARPPAEDPMEDARIQEALGVAGLLAE
jgi:hypothetical protein